MEVKQPGDKLLVFLVGCKDVRMSLGADTGAGTRGQRPDILVSDTDTGSLATMCSRTRA